MPDPSIATAFAFSLMGGGIVGGEPPRIVDVGDTPSGRRRIIPIENAIIDGPMIRGRVLPGGSDRQLDRNDGVLEMNAIWDLETHDGVVISVANPMIRHATPDVMARLLREELDVSLYYFRGWPRIEAPIGTYDWVNRSVFISSGIRTPTSVIIHFHRVL
jgi:Protein of unknown function (DUF3237)